MKKGVKERMKSYKQLFLEIANSTDYKKNWATGASWRYYIDEADRRVYIQFQETKTWQDWIFNFIVIPVKLGMVKGISIKVPMGNYLQWKSVYKDIVSIVNPYYEKGYDVYVTGWSQGGVTAGLFGFAYPYAHTVMYGTPKFLKKQQDIETYDKTVDYINFLYPDDPIRDVVPDYYRPTKTMSDGFVPDFPPVSLDDKHRIYGHATYKDFNGKEEF